MKDEVLSKLYKNTKKCPSCKKIHTGIILENGLIRLSCGVVTNADKRWRKEKNVRVWSNNPVINSSYSSQAPSGDVSSLQ